MSLIVTGSGESFSTSSCLQSGAIFLDSWKVTPHLFYDVTASISHRPENSCTASNTADLGYTVNSFDQSTGVWYHANQYGVPDTTGTYPSASITGSATRTNVLSGDCRYNAIQFSGSMILDIGTGSYSQVYLSIVTGSFSVSGVNKARPFDAGWNLSVAYLNSGSINAVGYQIDNATTKNALVGIGIGGYFPSSQKTSIGVVVSGSTVASNPPTVDGGPWNFGYTLTLNGEGIIRGFGYGTAGTAALQAQYNCIYETTPSK
jgi:hypothetical protein